MNKILATFLSILLSTLVYSQSYIEIGTGTENSSFPYNAWNYTWSKALYKASQMQGSKTITKIAIDYKSGSEKTLNNQKIYLKCVDITALDGSYEEPVSSGYTLIYEGNITFSANGWKVIDLSQSFEYDGSKSLVVLWENRHGSTPYANFNATVTTENVIKVSGSDSGFPTTSGFDPYPKALPNIRFYYDAGSAPETPGNIVPANNTIKVNIDSDLSFDLGANTTLYDVYLSTTESLVNSQDAAAKVVTNAPVSAPGTFSYSPALPFASKTKYFWRVVAKNATEETNSPVFSFETERIISSFPYNQGFEDQEIWTEGWYGDMTKTDWYYTNVVGSWNKYTNSSDPTSSYSGTYSAKCNPSATTGEFILMTPRINLPSSYELSFRWKNTTYIGTKVDGKDKTYVEISTDCAQTWNELGLISPSEGSNEWARAYFDLSSYSNDSVYIRWRYVVTEGQTGVPMYLDNVEIIEMSNTPKININPSEFVFRNLAVGGELSTSITISNIGSTDLVVSSISVDAPFSATYSGTLAPNQSTVVTIKFNPTVASNISKTLTVNITGDYSGENTLALSAVAEESITNIFQPFDISTSLPEGWKAINNPNHQFTKVDVVSSNFDSYSPSNVAKFVVFSENAYPVSLITPGLKGFNTNELSFFAKCGGDYDVDIVIGTQTDPYSTETFVEVDRFALTQEYAQFKPNIPTDNTRPYIVFRHGGNPSDYSVTSIWLDDVSWQPAGNNPPSPSEPVKPTDSQTNVDIMMPLVFQWIKNAGNPTGYKFYLGTNADANNLINGQVIEGGNNVIFTPSIAFSYSTTYKWKVVPYNDHGDASGCPVWSFTTMNDPLITSLPYTQNFDNISNQSGFTYPLGWSIENPGNDNICWDIIANSEASPNNAFSAPNAMHVAFHPYNPKNDFLFTPPVQLAANRSYAIDFKLQTLRDMVTNLIYTEKIKLLVGADNTSAAMTTQLLDTMTNQLGWKTPEAIFTPTTAGNFYFGFKAYSDANQYLLIIDNFRIQELFSVTFTVTDSLSNAISDAVITFNGTAYPAGVYAVNHIKAGNHSYSVSKNGFITHSGTVVVDGDKTIDVELLENRYAVTFNVVDQDDESITDAIVTFNSVVNEAGDYSFSQLLAGTYTYSVAKEGYASVQGEVVITNADVTVDVELTLITYNISFSVIDEYDEPLSDAIVTFNSITLGAGVYDIEGVVPGTYPYSVSKQGYNTVDGEVVVDQDSTLNIKLYLNRFSVTFNISDTEGNSINDAIVTFNSVTLNAGVYVINNLLAGTYSYSIAREDYSSFYGQVVVVDSDTTINAELVPFQLYTVSFNVVDVDQNPITDATITFEDNQLDPGDYIIEELESGTYSYSVFKEGYTEVEGTVIVNNDVTVDVTLVVPIYEYTVTFTVLNSNEQPIVGAVISINDIEDELTTNNQGIAAIDLENGSYQFNVNVQGYVEYNDEFTVNSSSLNIPIQMQAVGILSNDVGSLIIYPNPASKSVRICIPENISSSCTISVINIAGLVVDYIATTQDVLIDVSSYPKGIYIVSVNHHSGIASTKLIVQ